MATKTDLALLAANVQRVRAALAALQCIVSSGAAAVLGQQLGEFQAANAFGMTEVQQVLKEGGDYRALCGEITSRPMRRMS